MYKASAFVNGVAVFANDVIEIKSPLDNSVVGTIPSLSESQISEAFNSSLVAFAKWKLVDYKTRIKYLIEFAVKIREHANILSQILHLEVGKTIEEAHSEIMRSADYIVESTHEYADIMEKPEEYNYENNILMPKDVYATYVREPLGVILTISPFNYPVNLLITKVVPALLMGNSVVHKSATNGSLSGWYLAKLFHELSVDGYLVTSGVFNYVTGSGSNIGKLFPKFKFISALSFTGSTEVGFEISKYFPLIPKQLELGGHNPVIVMEDVDDLNKVVDEVCKGSFSFSGQRCTAVKRLFVAKKIYKDFLEVMKNKLLNFQLTSPLINAFAVKAFEEACSDAEGKGAILISPPLQINGNYVTPAVFIDVSLDMKIYSNEIFGPILFIDVFEKNEEVIEKCNNSRYGLQASIFSSDLDLSSRIALKLEFARININSSPARTPDVLPFGGIKDSGEGIQGIRHSLLFFSRFKGVLLKHKQVDV